ncbi:hypothetical protein VPHK449_0068 [Vibrio phage K449]|nr:adenylate cyclase [Vibrio phage PS14A.1]
MLSKITIAGLHSEPKTFRYGTILRILRKNGARSAQLCELERKLRDGEPAKFKKYELSLPSVKVWSETKNF